MDNDKTQDIDPDGGAREPESSAPFALEDLSGQDIAGCKILRKLGAGAMGAVYLAEQPSLRRQVAFKVLDTKFSRDLTYIERFEREARAAAILGHFNIVQVYDYGRQGEVYYIVNEYVDGGDVQALLDAEGVVSPEVSVDIVLQAARGLVEAGKSSIVHRDIKPENLMLTQNGVVKIADFGLAKAINEDAAVTQSGMIVGTPFYMSPEQAKGLKLDSRSDIYSLGITLFHLVTGQIPFDADSVIGVLLKQISAERPDPLAINPDLPAAIGKVVMRMMEKDPDDRYQSAVEVVAILERVADQLSGKGPPITVEVPRARSDRAERYKKLRGDMVQYLRRRKVTTAATTQMLQLIKSDAGVFVETAEAFEVDDIVDLRFSVPGRNRMYDGVGVVRWVEKKSDAAGVGITFLKVSPLPEVAPSSASQRRRPVSTRLESPIVATPATAEEAISALTKTPLHCRLLRYFYANSGQSVAIQKIANALGTDTRQLKPIIPVFIATGLMRRQTSGIYDLVWPEEPDLQQKIVEWVSKYGLL